MRRSRTSLLTILTLLALAACRPNPAARQVTMTDLDSTAIALSGDFDGPLGLQLWSLREYAQNDLRGTLERVHGLGFREVELAGTYDLDPSDFRAMLDEVGLEATSMHVSYELLRDSIDSVLDEARTLGVEFVGVAWIPHPEDQDFTVEMARQAAADFNRFGEAAAAQGLTFFYHVHGYEFRADDQGTMPFDVLATESDANNVKFEMDVFWTALPGVDPAALLRKYPDRWELMHLKDMRNDWPLGDHSGHAPAEADVPVGTGQIDYAAVLAAAEEIGLDRYYIEDESTTPLDNIPRSIDYLGVVRF